MKSTIMSESSTAELEKIINKYYTKNKESTNADFFHEFECWLFDYIKSFIKESLSGVIDNIFGKLNKKSLKSYTSDQQSKFIN